MSVLGSAKGISHKQQKEGEKLTVSLVVVATSVAWNLICTLYAFSAPSIVPVSVVAPVPVTTEPDM
jgi:hypothetical protein